MSPENVRHWKNFIETGEGYPPRKDLSEKQKKWLEKVWTWASTSLLGMDEPCVPDAIPRYTEERGFFYVPVVERDWNHIDGIGETTRLDGLTNYNRPDNLVPLSRRSHTGKGVRLSEVDEEYITHRDMWEARQNWYGFKKGKIAENPMLTLHDDRIEATKRGIIYHDSSWDNHFRELAERVTGAYLAENPKDPFPPKNGKKK